MAAKEFQSLSSLKCPQATITTTRGFNIRNRPSEGHVILVSKCSILVALLFLTHLTESVIIPPRFFASRESPPQVEHLHQHSHIGSDEPCQLSVNESPSLSVQTQSSADITVNLNRAIGQDIDVIVTVHSGPDLIDFPQARTQNRPETYDQTATNDNNTQTVNASQYRITYKANDFGDRPVRFRTNKLAGHAEIVCKIAKQPENFTIDDSDAFISIDVYKNWDLNTLSQIVGWIYFSAWSASFYFQVILNLSRKSVVGLNFDFLALNLLGFTCYSIFNFTLMFSDQVQNEYYKRYEYSRIPVEMNDLFFSLHAFALTLITVLQCFIYERGQQAVSLPASLFIGLCILTGVGLWIANLFNSVTILNVVLYLSYVKLVITIIKYVPQAFMNYQRKATTGWSIHNVLLDFTGGSFSLAQMFLLAYNYDDWVSIFGNFTKFGLGAISMSFDILFMLQHYVLYKTCPENLEDSVDSIPSPVISHSIRSSTYMPSTPRLNSAQTVGDPEDEENDEDNH